MRLSAQRLRDFERVCSQVTDEDLIATLAALVDVRSATGEERALARLIARMLDAAGLDGQEQAIDSLQSNAIGCMKGVGTGPSLLLYSPIDTVTSDDEAEDLPWAGRVMAPELRASARVADGHVFGLGAQNPKGHAACILVAAKALKAAGVQLPGTLRLGFGAGGMPTNARRGTRSGSGHGAGCAWMLQQGPRPDVALIAKSGWAVSWEEVGLAWYEIRVWGTHSYVGSRHLLPFVNPIVDAAALVQGLERWFTEWTEAHRSGLVAPQGVVSFIESGWERMPAFTPAMCRMRIDLRLSPRTSPEQADESLGRILESLAARHGAKIEWRRIVAIPGTTTPADSPIIRTAIEAWEAIEGRPHEPMAGLSGATDANILRAHGIPTARVGLPKALLPNLDFQLGMNAVAVSALRKLTRHLIYTSIAVCG